MAYNKRGYGMNAYYLRGDPFLGGLIKGAGKLLGGVAKTAAGIVPGPVGGILGGVGSILAPSKPKIQQYTGAMMNVAPPMVGIPGLPPTATGMPPGVRVTKQGTVTTRKRPRMNPGNTRALKRAIRREDAFVKLARSALKGSKYTITTRGSRRSRRDLPPGHSHVR